MRVIFAGTPEVALPAVQALAHSRHDLVAVVSRPDAPQGRSRRPVPSPVSAWAHANGIEVLTPEHPRDPAFIERLTELAPDCCPVVAYGALIPSRVLAVPRHGWVNVHFSLLPAYRGAAPVQRAIMDGVETTGISIFDLVPALDAGPTYRQEATTIGALETSGELLGRLAVRGADLLVDVLDSLEDGTAVATPQTEAGLSLAPKLLVEEARLEWSRAADALARHIRACNPAPGAWTTLRGERFRVLLARPTESRELGAGELAVERRRVLVGTGEGDLELITVQPAGRKPMEAAAWGRGLGQGTEGFDR
ncbi:MAG: methionyl-tRNA formyltransferase [Micropruina sp.]|nr:methionyl-tRNA formyltransferase [Micropruina sp.]